MTPDSRKQGCPEAFKAHTLKSSVSESLRGVTGGRKVVKFKGPSEDSTGLLDHQPLETFLDGDSVSRVFGVWGEPSRSEVLEAQTPSGFRSRLPVH